MNNVLREPLKSPRMLTTELVEVDFQKPTVDSRFDRLNVQQFLEVPLKSFQNLVDESLEKPMPTINPYAMPGNLRHIHTTMESGN